MHFTSRYVKRDGKLFTLSPKDGKAYQLFINELEEGAVVEMYMSVEGSGGSLSQLAKIHAMCRTLANHVGETFEDMKLLIKQQAGLVNQVGDNIMVKSFASCTRDELNMAIQAAIEIGQRVNCLVD